VLRLYLDPLLLFRNVSAGPPAAQALALRRNRRLRRILLAYGRRWATITFLCLAVIARLAALVRVQPLVWIPLAALEVVFSSGLCMSFFSIAAYVVLGLDD
jgi:hypothetical protein